MAKRFSTQLLAAVQVVVLLLVSAHAWASPATANQARQAVRGWLRQDGSPLRSRLGTSIARVETFADATGQSLYYVVYLQPAGFVIVPADDETEPIVCFAPAGTYDPSPANPLGALVSGDLSGRVKAVRGQAGAVPPPAHRSSHQGRWRQLSLLADSPVLTLGLSGVTDVRVAPFIQSRWDQRTENGLACYNYYTPPGPAGSASNYPTGCVATAMAQVMRYHQYPTAGVGVHAFAITVSGASQTAYTRGGNGSGGAYNWALMMLDPDYTINAAQREAIGALCYDAGIAVKMQYATGGSGAFLSDCRDAMVNTFRFTNAIAGYNNNVTIPAADLRTMMNPNLDAGYPVMLGILGKDSANNTYGHAVVSDGYGYDSLTLYHHLNMGWGGFRDAWYNLPTIDPSLPSPPNPAGLVFNTITDCLYNMYPTGSGEIVSGRVTDALGNPLAGLTVTAQRNGGTTYTATTTSTGVYALSKVPSNATYTVSVTGGGYTFQGQSASAGQSRNDRSTSGNYWGLNFQAQSTAPASPSNPSPSNGQAGVSTSASLSWMGAATDVTFDVYLDTISPPVQKVAIAQAAATFPPVPFQEATTYYWQVVAINAGGQTPGVVWSFRTHIPGDINSDGYVNVGDLQLLVATWGSGPGYAGPADLNNDGFVNVGDLQILVAHWGQS